MCFVLFLFLVFTHSHFSSSGKKEFEGGCCRSQFSLYRFVLRSVSKGESFGLCSHHVYGRQISIFQSVSHVTSLPLRGHILCSGWRVGWSIRCLVYLLHRVIVPPTVALRARVESSGPVIRIVSRVHCFVSTYPIGALESGFEKRDVSCHLLLMCPMCSEMDKREERKERTKATEKIERNGYGLAEAKSNVQSGRRKSNRNGPAGQILPGMEGREENEKKKRQKEQKKRTHRARLVCTVHSCLNTRFDLHCGATHCFASGKMF